ncbi:MAG: hypothetical protein R3B96_21480 [Pirellulaceae bacterium]
MSDKGLETRRPGVWLDSDRLGLERRSRPGPTNRLVVVRRGLAASTSPEAYPLGVLTHLEPDGDRASLQVWFSAGRRESLPERLGIRVIGDWELQGTTVPTGLVVDSERSGQELSLDVSLSALETPPTLIGLTLRSASLPAAGRYELPSITVPGANIVARHLVWRQPSTATWTIESNRGMQLAGVDTLATWWPSEQLVAMRVLEGQRQISARGTEAADWLRMTPLETITSVDHQWEVDFSSAESTWRSSTVVSVMRGELRSLQLESNVPFEFNTFEWEGPDGRQPLDVIRLSPRRLLLLLPAPQRTTFTVNGTGRFRSRPGEASPLPIMQLGGFDEATYRGRFTRSPDLKLQVLQSTDEGLRPILDATDPAPPPVVDGDEIGPMMDETLRAFADDWMNQRSAELVGSTSDLADWMNCWCVGSASTYPSLEQSVTRFERDAEGWLVTLRLKLAENDSWGADCFDVILPEGFTPLATEGEGQWSTVITSAANPIARWTSERRMPAGFVATLRGRLGRFPDGSVLPRVLAAREMPRIIEVPTAGPTDPFLWKYDRYRPLGASDGGQPEAIGEANLSSDTSRLRLLEEEPGATLRLASKPLIARPSRVFLAEHRISPSETGALVSSRFLLDPGGRSRVRLILPEGLEALRAVIDGEPREIDSSGAIELTSRELPQEILLESWIANSVTADYQLGAWSPSQVWRALWGRSAVAQENRPLGEESPLQPRDSRFSAERVERPTVAETTRAANESDSSWWRVPSLDVVAAKTIIAVRPSSRWSSWMARSPEARLDTELWRDSIDGASEEVRRSLATVAGLSPLAMERWSEAWLSPRPTGEVAGPMGNRAPQLSVDSETGELIWVQARESWPRGIEPDASPPRVPFSAQSTLPSDAAAWQVWSWEADQGEVRPEPRAEYWRVKALASIALFSFAAVVGLAVRWLPVTLSNWMDAGCVLGGLLWVATVEPVGPGIVLALAGFLPAVGRVLLRPLRVESHRH